MKPKTNTVTPKRKDNIKVLSHKKVTDITLDKPAKKKVLSEKAKVIVKTLPINNKKEKADKSQGYKSNTKVLSHEKVTGITLDKPVSKKLLSEKAEVTTKNKPVGNKKDDTLSSYKDNIKELSHENNINVTPQTALVAFNKPAIQNKLLNLANISDDLEEMLKHYKAKIKNVIEVPKIEINKKKAAGNVITRSFRIYEGVLKDFLKFAEKHDQFTIQDLLSQAVIEFIDHYHN